MNIKNINSFLQLQAIVGILLFSVACSPKITTAMKATTTYNFAQMKDNQFVVNDQPYYFIGTNFWYGMECRDLPYIWILLHELRSAWMRWLASRHVLIGS